MRSDKETFKKLENILKRAYREKEKLQMSEQWQKNVMRHIRSLEPINSKTTYFEFFEAFVWRFAPVVGTLILILAASLIYLDFFPEYEMAKVFIDDPIEFSYLQMFGV